MRALRQVSQQILTSNVVDDANDIAAALSGDTTDAMDNAASLIVSGGTATVAEAADIQGVCWI